MILGIVWWGMLLYKKNDDYYQLLKSHAVDADPSELLLEEQKQRKMIIGEGLVLGFSLLLGIYIIQRSAMREVKGAKQQSDFLLSVSHELKTPISAVKMALQTLERPSLSKDKQQNILKGALKESDRLEKLVQNILLTANLDSHKIDLYLNAVDPEHLIASVLKNYSTYLNDIIVEGPEHRYTIRVDEQNIRQALSNLIDNAFKYRVGKEPVVIRHTISDTAWELSVSNPGIPIPEKDLDRIFRKFERGIQTDIRKKEGTGIGLYIVKQVVAAHRGQIEVKSKSGFNSFKIKIPLQ